MWLSPHKGSGSPIDLGPDQSVNFQSLWIVILRQQEVGAWDLSLSFQREGAGRPHPSDGLHSEQVPLDQNSSSDSNCWRSASLLSKLCWKNTSLSLFSWVFSPLSPSSPHHTHTLLSLAQEILDAWKTRIEVVFPVEFPATRQRLEYFTYLLTAFKRVALLFSSVHKWMYWYREVK